MYWRQIERIWQVMFYVLLFLITLDRLINPTGSTLQQLLMFLALAGLAGWYWAYTLDSVALCDHPLRWRLRYILVGVALLLVPTQFNMLYMVLMLPVYPLIYTLLRLPYAIPTVISLNAAVFVQQVILPGATVDPMIVFWLIGILSGIVLALLIDAMFREAHERQQLIDRLQTTRDELAQVERLAGVQEERQRLAAELHDTLAQGFASIVMHLESLPPEKSEPPERRLHLDQALSMARDSLSELRRLVQALRPELLEQNPFNEAINALVQQWSRRQHIPAECVITGEYRPLETDTEVTLLRVTQEALTNVARHARAQQVTVTLSYMDDQIALDIHDNGDGFIPQAVRRGTKYGAGLSLMRDRAKRSGGELAIESTPGEGTTITVILPVEAELVIA